MLDFTKLRGGPDGWRGSFERLVVHLAEINRPEHAREFRRIEGAGGDGGLEAYWVCDDRSEIGYQAKFHLRSGEIGWSELDKSVRTALRTHPGLQHLVVFMPCDLTDAKQGRSTSAREKWERWRTKWVSHAGSRPFEVSFVGADQIERQLTEPKAEGIREYWLGERELSDEWFRRQFERTSSALDERYHPEDHVDVDGARIFQSLRGAPAWRDGLHRLVEQAARKMPPPPNPEGTIAASYSALADAIHELARLVEDQGTQPDAPFLTEAWISAADAAVKAAGQTVALIEDVESSLQTWSRRYIAAAISEVLECVLDLQSILNSQYQSAYHKRFAIIEGEAGSGKSHLMASSVLQALEASEPALMLLGTDFTSVGEPGVQIAQRLELSGYSTGDLLGVLQAAATHRRTRAVIAIDALNEGAGAEYWRERLSAFATQVRRYPRLTLCVSCRDVFSEYVFSKSVRKDAAQIEIFGFQTDDEQERAATVFMDRRGIARPPAPWLPPEFTNPLFLRTTCVSLQRLGRKDFPLGLRGARELMRFYLDAAAATLGTVHDGTDELFAPLISAFLGIASEMARNRVDHIEKRQAASILNAAFADYAAPANRSWLDVLRFRGLLRADPPPFLVDGNSDPLLKRPEVLRFAFQRFQDHLIARSLTDGQNEPAGLFDDGGPMSFMLGEFGIEAEWQGVFFALGIEFADKWKTEIVDHLPGGYRNWWFDPAVQDAFVESVRWRQVDGFTPRSAELLEALSGSRSSTDLRIELSVIPGHPWNADALHTDLVQRAMPKRDAYWTLAINGEPNAHSSGHRLANWGIGTGPASATGETIRLALTTLGWLFTSSNRSLRDCATKAAVEILVRRPSAQTDFMARFANVDDPYVVERALAAVAASCLRDPTSTRLESAAAGIWRYIFAPPSGPPSHVLLRDYGRLVMELAAEHASLPPGCDLTRCRPPYRSFPLRFGLKEDDVKAECEAVGDHSIFDSTVGWAGNFGDYVVKSKAHSFSTARLKAGRPLRRSEVYDDFKRRFTDDDEFRSTLLSLVESTTRLGRSSDMMTAPDGARWAEIGAEAERDLLSEIGDRGRARFETDARPFLDGKDGWVGSKDGRLELIDHRQARLWIARRAIRLGWTRKRFPHDYGAGDDTIRARRIERIGKKYQWIAYYELLARLADHHWLVPDWEQVKIKIYDTPLDLPFIRDVDPTIAGRDLEPVESSYPDTPVIEHLRIKEVSADSMKDWVFASTVPGDRLRQNYLASSDDDTDPWVTLYNYSSSRTYYTLPSSRAEAPFRLREFHFVYMMGIEAGKEPAFIDRAAQSYVDFYEWMDSDDLFDGPYLYELRHRQTWPDVQWLVPEEEAFRSRQYLRFSQRFHWERHLDGSLAEGYSLQVPSVWLLRELDLVPHTMWPGIFVGSDGKPIIASRSLPEQVYCVIRKSAIDRVLGDRGVIPMIVGTGERSAWPDPLKNSGPQRRWNGVYRPTGQSADPAIWAEDFQPETAARRTRVRL